MMSPPRARQLRVRGARFAALIAFVPAALLILVFALIGSGTIGEIQVLMVTTFLGGITLTGATIGWLWGPLAPTRGLWGPIGLIMGVAVSATVLGALTVSLSLVSGVLLDPSDLTRRDFLADVSGAIFGYWLLGLWYVGLVSLAGTVPLAIFWWWLVDVRHCSAHRSSVAATTPAPARET